MIHFFCALPCEAQPIIQNFKLSELKQFDLFRIYQSEDKGMSLTVTGIGKLNAASAVCYHHACMDTTASNIWLNIGVAGHTNINIGEIRLINKITDKQDNISWYPQIIFKPCCESASLVTLDKPSDDYQEVLFDMEASGFYQMAIRLGTTELIHCLKIVSDNDEQPTSTVNADDVKKIIARHIKTIENLLETLKPLSKEINSASDQQDIYQEIIDKLHFTQSERIQLSNLLRQWSLRLPNQDITQSVAGEKSGKAVLKSLRRLINDSEFVIHD
jgi:nucleoside phosphorylase